MSIVSSYTREQWYAGGEWAGVEPYVDGVVLLFREEESEEQDVLPRVVRIDPQTRKPWPEDAGALPDVPFRYYTRDEDNEKCWFLEDEGADQSAHERMMISQAR